MSFDYISRREFLKFSLATSFAGIEDLAFAQSPKKSIGVLAAPQMLHPFIVVFLRGGADGLAILSPLNDENFIAARPPEMRFAIDASGGKVESENAIFYWHPEASPLASLFADRKLIVWNAIGIKDETRSHFEAQEMMERGVNSLNSLPDDLGWMARQVISKTRFQANSIPLFAGNNNLPRSMQGAHRAIAVKDIQGGIALPNGANGFNALSALCNADGNAIASTWIRDHLSNLDFINQTLGKGAGKVIPYESSGKIPYPNADPGVGLRSVARLIDANVSLQYAWVDQSGWDTHENQPGRLNGHIKNLSNSLAAFAQDMEEKNQPYTLVVMTEFGRRLRSNRSNGTDHGHGSLGLIMGSNVPGGQLLGQWPGLSAGSLDRGVDLAVTTDYQHFLNQAFKYQKS
ncbi:DUF1501 domain-containing protein [Polynucleobacter sp. UB-Tiil-W10]|uniref:DUF1501 domain-containing protein n=1 Tax=Polynucleobacter sp. UB-Tiil-W10 TaxID=1855648 RepID=UPI001C0B1A52|nr:DUF1501 domain-containing protein [Polynucleobacter sp. UB-Tiil-W10]MBU3539708.1 DUF1501 domain-containing protein [Polynucleobacter sp. UB-Tiil-W10]